MSFSTSFVATAECRNKKSSLTYKGLHGGGFRRSKGQKKTLSVRLRELSEAETVESADDRSIGSRKVSRGLESLSGSTKIIKFVKKNSKETERSLEKTPPIDEVKSKNGSKRGGVNRSRRSLFRSIIGSSKTKKSRDRELEAGLSHHGTAGTEDEPDPSSRIIEEEQRAAAIRRWQNDLKVGKELNVRIKDEQTQDIARWENPSIRTRATTELTVEPPSSVPRVDLSMKARIETLRLQQRLLGDFVTSSDVALTLNNIGNIHFGRGEIGEAMKAYNEALAVSRGEYSSIANVHDRKQEQSTFPSSRSVSLKHRPISSTPNYVDTNNHNHGRRGVDDLLNLR